MTSGPPPRAPGCPAGSRWSPAAWTAWRAPSAPGRPNPGTSRSSSGPGRSTRRRARRTAAAARHAQRAAARPRLHAGHGGRADIGREHRMVSRALSAPAGSTPSRPRELLEPRQPSRLAPTACCSCRSSTGPPSISAPPAPSSASRASHGHREIARAVAEGITQYHRVQLEKLRASGAAVSTEPWTLAGGGAKNPLVGADLRRCHRPPGAPPTRHRAGCPRRRLAGRAGSAGITRQLARQPGPAPSSCRPGRTARAYQRTGASASTGCSPRWAPCMDGGRAMTARPTDSALGAGALDEIVRVSRALGSDPALVLHGGGNTSIKATGADVTGDAGRAGARQGQRLGPRHHRGRRVRPAPSRPAARAVATRRPRATPHGQRAAPGVARRHRPDRVDRGTAARPPARPGSCCTRHADAIVALTDQRCRAEQLAEVLGEGVARAALRHAGLRPRPHGRATDARAVPTPSCCATTACSPSRTTRDAALGRHRELVARRICRVRGRPAGVRRGRASRVPAHRRMLATLRRDIARAAGRPLLVRQSTSARALRFARRDDLARRHRARHGDAGARHPHQARAASSAATSMRTRTATCRYVDAHRAGATASTRPRPGPARRAGPAARPARGRRRLACRRRRRPRHRSAHHGHRRRRGSAGRLPSRSTRRTASTSSTGSSSRPECAPGPVADPRRARSRSSPVRRRASAARRGRALLAQGATVVGIDLSPAVASAFSRAGWRGVVGDVTDPAVLRPRVETAAREFGGHRHPRHRGRDLPGERTARRARRRGVGAIAAG